jgi:hypothetical protein
MVVIRNIDAIVDDNFMIAAEKDTFIDCLTALALQVKGDRVMSTHEAEHLSVALVFSNRRGYQLMSEPEFQKFLASQFNSNAIGSTGVVFMISIFKHMADSIIEGIRNHVNKVSAHRHVGDRATLELFILFRLNQYIATSAGEPNELYRECILAVISEIRKSLEKKQFTASYH